MHMPGFLRLMAASCALVSLGFSFGVEAQVRYEANLSNTQSQDWSVQASKISCVLSYSISDYGRGDFVLLSGAQKKLSFELFPFTEIASKSRMRVISAPPEWKPHGAEHDIGEIELYKGFRPFVGNSVSWAMLRELSVGKRILMPYEIVRPTFRETLIPVLSPMGFNKAFAEFNDCSSNLINIGYSDVEMIALMFYEKEERLTPNSEDRLRDQITYTLLDPSIKRIEISAFGSGSVDNLDNLALAKKRAESLAQVFKDSGISEDLLEIKTFGDEQLATTGYTMLERRQSSKALIHLVRDPFKVDHRESVDMPDIGVPDPLIPQD